MQRLMTREDLWSGPICYLWCNHGNINCKKLKCVLIALDLIYNYRVYLKSLHARMQKIHIGFMQKHYETWQSTMHQCQAFFTKDSKRAFTPGQLGQISTKELTRKAFWHRGCKGTHSSAQLFSACVAKKPNVSTCLTPICFEPLMKYFTLIFLHPCCIL